jgi:hypothetical protein
MADLKQHLKKWFMRTGQHGKTGQSLTLENRSLNLTETSQASEGNNKEKIGGSSTIGGTVPDIENPDPTKARIRYPRKIGGFTRWLRRTKFFWHPPLTPDEKDDLATKQIMKAKKRNLEAEAHKLNILIPNSYASMGIEYVRTSHKGHEREKIQRVSFSKWEWTVDGNTFYGKVRYIPYGHMATELVRDEVLTGLSFSVGHPVGGRCDDSGGGVMISVAVAGKLDMPDLVKFEGALPLISESAPPLSVFVGVGENGSKHVYNLEELPHLLIGGTTGSGKSVMLTAILATIIARNSPKDIRLLLADLKQVDLTLFEGVPHLLTKEIPEIPEGIVKKDEQIIPMFKWLEKENNRRQAMFGHERIRNLAEWNRKHRNRYLPRIIVAVDEFARLMRSESQKKEFIALTYDLASTARATGIYLILATQFAKDKYITTDIKMNIPGRIAFSVPDLQGSVALIDSNEAVNLYPPAGRGIFSHGVNKFRFQAPFITTGQIIAIVKSAQDGKTLRELPVGGDLTEEEIIRWALTENNGYLQTNNTFQHFTPRIEQAPLKIMLQEMDEKIYTIESVEYKVVPPAGGSRGRKVVKVELTQEGKNDE